MQYIFKPKIKRTVEAAYSEGKVILYNPTSDKILILNDYTRITSYPGYVFYYSEQEEEFKRIIRSLICYDDPLTIKQLTVHAYRRPYENITNFIHLTSLKLYNEELSFDDRIRNTLYYSVYPSHIIANLNTEMIVEDLYKLIDENIIHKAVGNLTFLRRLQIKFTVLALSKLPESLTNLRKLTELTITGNKIDALSRAKQKHDSDYEPEDPIKDLNEINALPDFITQLTSLRRLNIYKNELTSLPDLRNLTQLYKLNLSHNYLYKLPTFDYMKNLTYLNLEGNKLYEFSINLRSLEYLNLSHTHLTKVHIVASFLKYLNLAENRLTSIFIFTNTLEHLDMSYNDLRKIPKIEQYGSLKYLNLSNNKLFVMPDFMLRNLTYLNWENNELKQLSSDFVINFPRLQHLRLRKNLLSFLPTRFFALKHLISLDLRENELVRLPEHFGTFGEFTFLKKLYLSANMLETLPDLNRFVNLRELNLNDNELTFSFDLIDRCTSLVKLGLAYCDLKNISETISNFQNLDVLNVMGNSLTSLPSSFSKLTHLTRLFLGENELTSIDLVTNLIKLKELDMEDNKIAELPEDIDKLTQLKILGLAENFLVELPESISNMTSLTDLDLYNNSLVELPYDIYRLRWLKKFDISGNSFRKLDLHPGEFIHLEKEYKDEMKEILKNLDVDLTQYKIRETEERESCIICMSEDIKYQCDCSSCGVYYCEDCILSYLRSGKNRCPTTKLPLLQ